MRRERSEEIERLRGALAASVAEGARLRADVRRATRALERSREEMRLSAERARASADEPPSGGFETSFDAGECVFGQFSSCDAKQIAQHTSLTFLAVVALLAEQGLSDIAVRDLKDLAFGGGVGDPLSLAARCVVPMTLGLVAFVFKKLTDTGHFKIKL